jgi:hypothetical protein
LDAARNNKAVSFPGSSKVAASVCWRYDAMARLLADTIEKVGG